MNLNRYLKTKTPALNAGVLTRVKELFSFH